MALLTTFQLPAPCKLNLCLNITGQRADGYHVLQTAFQLLDFCDLLTFSAAPRLQVSELAGVKSGDNLVYRAARLLAQHTGCEQGVDIQLHKQVPSGAGLGGGSSDAATTLIGLNHFWQTGLNLDELAILGLSLGADVPVFVNGQSAWAEGVGEQLRPLSLPSRTYVVIQPNCQISTREIFLHPGLTRHSSPITIARFLEVGGNNDCEAIVRVLYPEVDAALRWLSRWGLARMTGTGSCVYVEVTNKDEAQAVLAEKPTEWFGFSAQGVNTSALHTQLNKLNRR